MNFTKGLMLTCGATGAILAAVAMTGLSYDLKGVGPTGKEARLTPHIVTLSPIPLILGAPDDVVLVSLSLTVPSAIKRAVVCARANVVQSTATRLIKESVRASSPTGTTIPSDLDRILHAAIAGIVGDKQVERVAVIVTPVGATPPAATCP